MIALVVLASIIGYAAIGGVTYEITPPDGDDHFRCGAAALLWPVALPAMLAAATVRRVREWREDRALVVGERAALPPARTVHR